MLCLLIGLALALTPVSAVQGTGEMGWEREFAEPLADFYAALPEELREQQLPCLTDGELPDTETLRAAGSADALLEQIKSALLDALPSYAGVLGQMCLCILFSALLNVLCTAFGGGKLGEIGRMCALLCMGVVLLKLQHQELAAVTHCLRQMQTMVNAMLPMLGVVFAAGGNTAMAGASCSSLLLFLNLAENLCTTLIYPLISAACGLSAVSGLLGGDRLRGMLNCLKRVVVFLLGLFGVVFSTVLGAQTTLASGADNIAARSVKFAVSSAVPVVGGAVSETVRTVSAGLGYLKNTVGILGLILTIWLVLPPLVRLLCYRLTLFAGSAMADLLGCERESKLMNEFASLGGLLLALLSVCVAAFVLALILFVRISLAIGG